MIVLKRLLDYLNIFKNVNGKGDKGGVNLKMMHGINRISIVMFLIAIVIIIYKWVS